ncbi:MAG: HAD-IB family phosphatase [Elusimicrobiales bacterium]
MKIALVTDFDGTITTRDVGDFLLLYFKLATLEEIEDSYRLGIKIEEWMKTYFSRMNKIKKEDVKKAVRENIKIREGFKEAVESLKKHNMPVEVVSGGVDLYIEEVFSIYGIDLKGFYGKFNDGKISFDFLGSDTLSDFKAYRVDYYKNLGYKTIFCGDAVNDYKAAKKADIAFAALRLKEILKKENYPFKELDDFKELKELINASVY